MITARDIKIIDFTKKFGITIEQAYKMFFNEAKYGMDLARKRLRKLHQEGHLLRGKSWDTNKTVYYLNRVPSTHKILLADFYSTLIYHGAMILEFIPEYKTSINRADGFVRYIYNGYEVIQFIEVVLTHKVNFENYEKLKESNEMQNGYGIFPSIVVIDQNPITFRSNNLNIINVDHSLKNFRERVLP